MPSKRQEDNDKGDDQPFVAANRASKKMKRPLKKKTTGASAATERISSTAGHNNNVVNELHASCVQNTTKTEVNATMKRPRKPERSTSTHQPLVPPNRDDLVTKRQAEPSTNRASLYQHDDECDQPAPPKRTTTADSSHKKILPPNKTRASFKKAGRNNSDNASDCQVKEDERMKRQLQEQDDAIDTMLLPARAPQPLAATTATHKNTMDQSETSTNSSARRREQVVAQTVCAGDDDSSLAADHDLKASLRWEQEEYAALHAAKSASGATYYVQGRHEDTAVAGVKNDDDDVDQQETLPGPLPLPIRQSATAMHPIQPGAYQGNPGEGFRRNDPYSKTAFVATAPTSGSARQAPPMMMDSSDTNSSTRHRTPPASLFAAAGDDSYQHDDELVHAKPVGEQEECFPTSVAKPADEYGRERQRRRLLWLVGVLLVLGIILVLGLIIGLIVRSQKKDSASNQVVYIRTPSLAPSTMAPTDFVIGGLPEHTLQIILEDPDSPQNMAYQWSLNDPYLMDYTESRNQQRFALATLFFATNTNYPTNSTWNTSTHWLDYETNECQWFPVGNFLALDCNPEGKYLRLLLMDNQLDGTLPPEISLLTSLTEINISNNQLHGSLPSEIGLLQNLESIQVQNNIMTASLPTELGTLTSLGQLYLFDNYFIGSLPTHVGLLLNLFELQMQRTSLSGQLPTELGNLSVLSDFFLWNTKLTGTLPTEIGRMSGLTEVAMHNGVLGGTIPSELGLLANLEYLQLDGHNLLGTIPSELSQLQSIQFLSVGSNQLTSSIPTELALLSDKLKALRFFQNQLTGGIPTELGRLSLMERLELDTNKLTQSIPTELGEAPFLLNLFLANNQLTGALPPELGSLPLLQQLTLQYNSQLRGTIPEEWEELASRELQELFLAGVDITGTIPFGMCTIDRLQIDCDADVCGCDCRVCQ